MTSCEKKTCEASSEDNNNILSQSSDLDKQAQVNLGIKQKAINDKKSNERSRISLVLPLI